MDVEDVKPALQIKAPTVLGTQSETLKADCETKQAEQRSSVGHETVYQRVNGS